MGCKLYGRVILMLRVVDAINSNFIDNESNPYCGHPQRLLASTHTPTHHMPPTPYRFTMTLVNADWMDICILEMIGRIRRRGLVTI